MRKKDKAILTELKQFEKNTETQTESISVKASSCNTLQVHKKDVAIQTELKQFEEIACNTVQEMQNAEIQTNTTQVEEKACETEQDQKSGNRVEIKRKKRK